MELMLDTANLEEIAKGISTYPISGVTTNPSIIKEEAAADFFAHMHAIRLLIGHERSLHVQVVAEECDHIIAEAEKILSILGDETFIKIPVTEEGLKAIRILSKRGVSVTATAVYTTLQGILAMLSGARYIAVYYNRMLNIDIDAPKVIKELSGLLWANAGNCQVLAASFKNISEITTAYAQGASCCTVPLNLLTTGLEMPSIAKAVRDFHTSWSQVYGEKTILDL
ncbi:fructose-6-phosphate aldolase [Sphaerochaeta sp. PS]|uniref:fructose-6-phosphate aldolase n=1 Tax=Sphaerochaeta sp. PS TaxID=3076336 RepID=UPI0028A379D8|nr:fructose-6-phosphate aldolase [Sphaerochaeta sp. PS]MDT4761293.1 fructose-6-phosphate aldolase [Sphaerochaeta sp. PS]